MRFDFAALEEALADLAGYDFPDEAADGLVRAARLLGATDDDVRTAVERSLSARRALIRG